MAEATKAVAVAKQAKTEAEQTVVTKTRAVNDADTALTAAKEAATDVTAMNKLKDELEKAKVALVEPREKEADAKLAKTEAEKVVADKTKDVADAEFALIAHQLHNYPFDAEAKAVAVAKQELSKAQSLLDDKTEVWSKADAALTKAQQAVTDAD
eukprot:Tbor_TRINITY_DN5769_c0_g1::TRINITY_DN5769_c0_g1_i13::g.20033::m.20033